jgi:hypothetical protein
MYKVLIYLVLSAFHSKACLEFSPNHSNFNFPCLKLLKKFQKYLTEKLNPQSSVSYKNVSTLLTVKIKNSTFEVVMFEAHNSGIKKTKFWIEILAILKRHNIKQPWNNINIIVRMPHSTCVKEKQNAIYVETSALVWQQTISVWIILKTGNSWLL